MTAILRLPVRLLGAEGRYGAWLTRGATRLTKTRLIGVPAALGAGLAGLGTGLGFGIKQVGEALREARGDPLERAEKALELEERRAKLAEQEMAMYNRLLQQQRTALDPLFVPYRMMPGFAPEWAPQPESQPRGKGAGGLLEKIAIGVVVTILVNEIIRRVRR